jgi:hypothetical protein
MRLQGKERSPRAHDLLARREHTAPTPSRPYIGTSTKQKEITMATSIFSRKRDLVYLIFFIVHVPVMLGEFSRPLISSAT